MLRQQDPLVRDQEHRGGQLPVGQDEAVKDSGLHLLHHDEQLPRPAVRRAKVRRRQRGEELEKHPGVRQLNGRQQPAQG